MQIDYKPRLLMPSAGRKVMLLRALEKHFRVYPCGLPPQDSAACCLAAFSRFVELPRVDAGNFKEELLRAIRRIGIHVVLPVRNEDMETLGGLRSEIEVAGAKLIMSDLDTVRACSDKLVLQSMISQGIGRCSSLIKRTPTVNILDWKSDFPFPVFVKERRGAGSRFAWRVNDETVLKLVRQERADLVVQPFLTGQEFSVDMFFGSDHKLVQAVVRKRLRSHDGQMECGVVVEPDEFLGKTNVGDPGGWNSHGFLGPVNVQMFKCDDGVIRITDINPRFPGGIGLTIAAGADFALYLRQMVDGKPITVHDVRVGTRAVAFTDYVFA